MINLEDVGLMGSGLNRPESVITTKSGDIFVSHNGHGVMRIAPDGTQYLLHGPADFGGMPLVPNGIALRHDGSFLIANIADAGGVMELDADGLRPHPVCSGGTVLPPVNFVHVDHMRRY